MSKDTCRDIISTVLTYDFWHLIFVLWLLTFVLWLLTSIFWLLTFVFWLLTFVFYLLTTDFSRTWHWITGWLSELRPLCTFTTHFARLEVGSVFCKVNPRESDWPNGVCAVCSTWCGQQGSNTVNMVVTWPGLLSSQQSLSHILYSLSYHRKKVNGRREDTFPKMCSKQ